MMLREILEWHDVADLLPNDDETVMIYAPLEDCGEPIWFGWICDGQWYVDGSAPIDGVQRWAKMPTGEATP